MYPVSRGRTAYSAHVQVPEGLFEEEHGRDAFTGPCSHLYRLHPPTAWEDIEGPLRPHAFDLNAPGFMEGAQRAAVEILSNDDCAVSVWVPTAADEFFHRDANGDLTYFIHHGDGVLESDYGDLGYEAGDYLIVPKGSTHRILPRTEAGASFFLIIETADEVEIPTAASSANTPSSTPPPSNCPNSNPATTTSRAAGW